MSVWLVSSVNLVLAFFAFGFTVDQSDPSVLSQALERAGDNRVQLERALDQVPESERAGMLFLIENMPEADLRSLTAEFLLENSQLTWKALNAAAWKDSVPQEVVLDSLLPYANINERRDAWRRDFYERFSPLVAEAKTSSEAAAILNQKIFPTLNVKYSTGRKKADQSPYETIESGLASCTGLSVLLVDACRAVGVPARIVGTPLWSDRSGNHTWVEIWDNGWHFTGACEPSGNDLNKAWFIDRASQAKRDERLHAIYAVTFRRNGQAFPMVWANEKHDVYAVNVTDRYTSLGKQVPDGHATVRIRVVSAITKQRIAVPVQLVDSSGMLVFEGTSKDERFDSNDHVTTWQKIGASLKVQSAGVQDAIEFIVRDGEQLIEVVGSTAGSETTKP